MRTVVVGEDSLAAVVERVLLATGHEVERVHPLAETVSKSADVAILLGLKKRAEAEAAFASIASSCQKLVVGSTQTLYTPYAGLHCWGAFAPSSVPISEMAPLREDALDPSGQAPQEVERFFSERADSHHVRIIRLPVLYGEGESGWFLEPFLRRMQMKRPAIVLPPEIGNFRWTHGGLENAAHAMVLAATVPSQGVSSFEIYHVGEGPLGYTPTVGERLHAVARAVGYRGQIAILPKDVCPANLRSPLDLRFDLIISDHLIRRALGFTEIVTEKDAFLGLAAWVTLQQYDPLSLAELEAEDVILERFGLLPRKRGSLS